MKLISKIQKFMCGRYGSDELYHFLLKVYILLFIVSIFLKSNVFDLFLLIFVIVMFYRVFSKNISKRQEENIMFLNIKSIILKKHYTKKNNKNKIYKKCPKCHTTLRLDLPYKRGFKTINCPKCKRKIKTLVLKTQKIEVIRDKKQPKKKY